MKHQLLAFALLLSLFTAAQGTKEDYTRAAKLKEKFKDKVLYAPDKFEWIGDKNKVLYSMQTPKGKEFILADLQSKTKRPAFDQTKVAAALSTVSGKNVSPYNLPFVTITIPSENEIEFIYDEKVWRYDQNTDKLAEKNKVPAVRRNAGYWGDRDNEQNGRPVKSPDGKWAAYVRNYNVYVGPASDSTDPGMPLSFDGSEGEYYSAYMVWSPDSKKLVANKVRPNKQHLVYLIESSPSDQLQPKLHTRNYLKPGDALPQRQPVLFIINDKKSIAVDPDLISSQYSLSNPVWRKDSRSFTFEYNQRGHQVYKIIEVNGTAGEVKDIVDERSKTFIEYSGKKYRFDIADGKEIIWASERDGWNHLYLYDGITGKVKNQITKGEWVVRNVVKVDEINRTIIFEGSGKQKDQDPYFIQYYKVNFDGTGLTALTTENGNHTATFPLITLRLLTPGQGSMNLLLQRSKGPETVRY